MTEIPPNMVLTAAEQLSGIANRTPIITSRTLNQLTQREIFLKCENFQRVGAFKFRGAYNAISRLTEEQKQGGVITHSSGNHAQGVALAAKLLEIKAVIVMPDDAPAIKKAATADYGADIVQCAAIDREQVCADLVATHGYSLIHPYDNDDIIAGQGTAALEFLQDIDDLDVLMTPVGGGGLLSGTALAAAISCPSCKVIGVEPTIAADANRSWRENRIHTLDHVPATIADGLRTRFIGKRNLAIMHHYVHDMTSIDEKSIIETMKFLWYRLKLVVEPSAAVPLAALLSGQYDPPGERIGIILSGGNVDLLNIIPTLQ
jgi:threo-3-hydroxy-L-aspartate ammonia-lyase